MKQMLFDAAFFAAIAFTPAHSEEEKCPLRNWDKVKTNLEFTANTPGPDNRGCAEAKVHGGETAFRAFKECNASLRNQNGSLIPNSSMYDDCAPQACNWFKAQNPPWSPAC
jgi:hypothetical protein